MRSNLANRLAELESAKPAIKRLSEDDPRVIAYRAKSHRRLAEKVLEAETGIKTHERLSPAEQVAYWKERVEEAEYSIANHGKTPDHDLQSGLMGGASLRIMQDLNYEMAVEDIAEFRRMLAEAQEACRTGNVVATKVERHDSEKKQPAN